MTSSCARASSFLLLALFGCGGDDEGNGEASACGLEEILEGTEFEDVGKLASISVHEDADACGGNDRCATGKFIDFTDFDGADPPALVWDGVCAGVNGLPVEGENDPVPLDTPEVDLVIDGEIVPVPQAGQGKVIAPTLEPFVDGGDMSLEVRGGDGEADFPSFTAELSVPRAPAVTGLAMSGGAFVVRWEPASADAVMIEVNIVEAPDGYQPVRCVVKDDGCLTVPSGAILWVTQSTNALPLDVEVTTQVWAEWLGTADTPEIGFFEVKRTTTERFEP
ncbi:MAG: hypothetical protein HYY06_00655 [Deltaproteobacteria bacterium]|nr:hypothetical protein [Deltaproteobacteria bacterium]